MPMARLEEQPVPPPRRGCDLPGAGDDAPRSGHAVRGQEDRRTSRRSPGSTLVPEGTASRSTVPEAGALIADSIFIASIVPICRPASPS